jgi:hypothetical protein
LRASEVDEEAFQSVSQELTEKIKKLQSLKADKAELNSLRELVVQAEANIYKSGGQRRASTRIDSGGGNGGGSGRGLGGVHVEESVSEHLDEIYSMLANKVDRSEFELWVEDLQRNKKGRRITFGTGKTKPKSQFGGNISLDGRPQGNLLTPIPEEVEGRPGKAGVTNLTASTAGILPDDGGM